MGTSEMSQEMQQCVQICTECHKVCLTTVQHCLQMGGEHAAPHHIGLLFDCAQICQTSADFMLRNSEFHSRTCAVCAEVCEHCAQVCEQIGGNDQQMQLCAEICRRCAESCHSMAGMMSA